MISENLVRTVAVSGNGTQQNLYVYIYIYIRIDMLNHAVGLAFNKTHSCAFHALVVKSRSFSESIGYASVHDPAHAEISFRLWLVAITKTSNDIKPLSRTGCLVFSHNHMWSPTRELQDSSVQLSNCARKRACVAGLLPSLPRTARRATGKVRFGSNEHEQPLYQVENM